MAAASQQHRQSSFQCQYRVLFFLICILALSLYVPALFDIHKRSFNNWMGGVVDFDSNEASGTRIIIEGKTTNTKPKKEEKISKCNEPWLPNMNMINHTLLKQRMLPLSIKDHKFSYVHISKCAGASWIRELRDLLPAFKPYRDIGEEFGVAYQRKKLHQIWFKEQQQQQQQQLAVYNDNNDDDNNIVLMTSFKHPRAHVWSLWGECAFDKIWKHPPIPYNPQSTYEKNFETWLNHFLQVITRPKSSQAGATVDYDGGFCLHDSNNNNNNNNNTTTTTTSISNSEKQQHDDNDEDEDMVELYNFKATDCFDCYHPANYQCRPFVAPIKQVYPHCVALLPNDQYKYTPNLDVVRRVRNEFAWISISEFFHESKCLLYHRLSKNSNKESRAEGDESIKIVENTIHDYLDRFCRCPIDTEGIKNQTVTVKHFQQGKRKSMLGLPTKLLKKIDFFVKQDIINYRESLVEFVLSVVQMEKELDRRILCDTTISKWEPEFEYIGLYNDGDDDDDDDGDSGGSKFRLSQIYEWAQNNI